MYLLGGQEVGHATCSRTSPFHPKNPPPFVLNKGEQFPCLPWFKEKEGAGKGRKASLSYPIQDTEVSLFFGGKEV